MVKPRKRLPRTTHRYGSGTQLSIVHIENRDGWLRLRWTYQGKRKCLSLGLPDDPISRIAAQEKAAQIQKDIALDQYDPTLAKYKGITAPPPPQVPKLTVVELFQQFTNYKAMKRDKRTLTNYQKLPSYLGQHFGNQLADEVTEHDSLVFASWFKNQDLSPRTQRDRIILVRACWKWAMTKGFVVSNPWDEVMSLFKDIPKQDPDPFTKDEVEAIIQAFQDHQHYQHYRDFVFFLLGSGCRTGEAIGLRWRHCINECSVLWIGESISRGVRKTTKTGKVRRIPLSPPLRSMLLARRPAEYDPEGLVFPSPQGHPIDDHNFRNRAWKTILSSLGIPYRKPYNTRHTFITHALNDGCNPYVLAKLSGHTQRTMEKHYGGLLPSMVLPDVLPST